MAKSKVPVSQLPVMEAHCKSCPFKPDERGIMQDVELANKVIERTLFKGQQLCHSSMKNSKRGSETHRCKGAFDFCKTIYDRMNMPDLISKELR